MVEKEPSLYEQVKATIRNNVREVRERRKMSMLELAQKTGYSYQFIASVEAGSKNLSLESLVKISEVLRISPGVLLGFDLNKYQRQIKDLYEKYQAEFEEIFSVLR